MRGLLLEVNSADLPDDRLRGPPGREVPYLLSRELCLSSPMSGGKQWDFRSREETPWKDWVLMQKKRAALALVDCSFWTGDVSQALRKVVRQVLSVMVYKIRKDPQVLSLETFWRRVGLRSQQAASYHFFRTQLEQSFLVFKADHTLVTLSVCA